MPLFKDHIGINLTSSKMQLVEVNFNGEEFTLENVDEEYFEDFLKFDEKEVKIVSILQSAYNELIMRKPIQSKNVSFTLPHDFFRVIQVPYDKTLSNEESIEQFKWELSLLFPRIQVDDYIIQYIAVPAVTSSQSENVIIVALSKKIIRILNEFCSLNKLVLSFIDNAHFASDRLITLDDSLDKNDGILSVYISNKYFSIMYLVGQDPIGFDIIPINHVSEILPNLMQELKSNKFTKSNIEIKKAYITGENISDSLLEKSENLLNIKFNRLSPFQKIKANPYLFNNKMFNEKSDSFSSATGIAFRTA